MLVQVVHARPAGDPRPEQELLGQAGDGTQGRVHTGARQQRRGQRLPYGEVDMILSPEPDRAAEAIEAVDGAKYTSSLGRNGSTSTCSRRCPASTTSRYSKRSPAPWPRQQIVAAVVKDANDQAAVVNNTQFMVQPGGSTRRAGRCIRMPATSPRPTRCLTRPAGHAEATGPGPRVASHSRSPWGTTDREPGPDAGRADHAAAVPGDRGEAHDQNTPDMLYVTCRASTTRRSCTQGPAVPIPTAASPSGCPPAFPRGARRSRRRPNTCDGSGLNYTKMAGPKVDSLLSATDQEVDPTVRASLFNDADLQMAKNDVP